MFLFRENRLIYQDGGLDNYPKPSDAKDDISMPTLDWGSGLGALFGSMGHLAIGAARIVNSAASVADHSTKLLVRGLNAAEIGVDKMARWANHVGIKPVRNLAIYQSLDQPGGIEMGKDVKTDIPELDKAIDYQVKLAFLNYKENELNLLYTNALNEWIRIRNELDERYKKKGERKDELDKIEKDLPGLKKSVDFVNHPDQIGVKSDREVQQIEASIAIMEQNKAEIEEEIGPVAMWEEPKLVEVVFPIGVRPQGSIMRFMKGPGKVKLDLNLLFEKVLPSMILKLGIELAPLAEQAESLAWARDAHLKTISNRHPDKMQRDGDWHKMLIEAQGKIERNLFNLERTNLQDNKLTPVPQGKTKSLLPRCLATGRALIHGEPPKIRKY